MNCLAAQSHSTRAEDRATLRSDPSADPGVGVEGRVGVLSGSVSVHPFNFNIKASNLRGMTPRPFDRTSLNTH